MVLCVCHWNWTNLTPVSWSSDDYDWGIVCWSKHRKAKSGEIKARGRSSVLVRGYFLSGAFCAAEEDAQHVPVAHRLV